MRVLVTGIGACTPAGSGVSALWDALDQRRRCFSEAPPYEAEGLAQPRCGVAPIAHGEAPAQQLLQAAVAEALQRAGLTPSRTAGLVVGTSSGNLGGPWERWHAARLQGENLPEETAQRDAPTRWLAEELGLVGPQRTVSIACSSGTAVLEVAERWLRSGRCSVVLACGVDALSRFVHAGFAGLGALSASGPRPFQGGRDGLLLGEAGACLVLESEEHARERGGTELAELGGCGLAMDAFHLTAPHREGRGAARAMRQALARAGVEPQQVDQISVHGTATVFNDAMEARALRDVFDDQPVALHGVKGSIGHSLGAAGAVEAVVVVESLVRGEHPPGIETPAEDCPVRTTMGEGAPSISLSTSSAFGGMNAAVVLARPGVLAVPPRASRPAGMRAEVLVGREAVDWSVQWPERPRRWGRLDDYNRLCLWAVHELLVQTGPLPEATGLVLASRRACRLADLRYHERLLTDGAAQVSRMDFTYTIAGAPLAEASIHFGYQGPVSALVGPPTQALHTAWEWVERGQAPAVVALAADVHEPGRLGRVKGWVIGGVDE